MVDTSTVLRAVALPTSRTPFGILKLEIVGAMLVLGVLIATFGLHRWYKMGYEDWLLMQKRDEMIEQLEDAQNALIEAGKIPGVDFNPEDYEINLEDYEPPLRSHILNYIFFFGGVALGVCGLITYFMPA